MKPLYLNFDPQESGPQYLEDLATGYWFSEALFTAVEAAVFDLLAGRGMTADELARNLQWEPRVTERFLHALCALGLLFREGENFFNTSLAAAYLVREKENYQGDSILWRKYLQTGWGELGACLRSGGRVSYMPDDRPEHLQLRIRGYIQAMDNVARTKVQEILPLFMGSFNGTEILDVGAGSGAISAGFLEHFPGARATLLDLTNVLEISKEMMDARGLGERVACCPVNILEPWPVPAEHYDLVILSNIVHAYSQHEVPDILARAAWCLSHDGYLLIHDFFQEHSPSKAALSDLNMLINTYNGHIFPGQWVQEQLSREKLQSTELLPLQSDTAVIIASRNPEALDRLNLDNTARLISRLYALGFRQFRAIPAGQVQVADWVNLRCRYGCSLYGRPHCPPDSPGPDQTRAVLKEFETALLLEGEPPTGNFQRRVLKAEKEAFRAGYYKALAYWAGPCSLCSSCPTDGCRNTKDARPSMEAAGIDVFATVRQAGLSLKTLDNENEYVKYYALLLLE